MLHSDAKTSPQDAVTVIGEVFADNYGGQVASCRSLGGEWDRTYVLTTSAGERHVVKLFAAETGTENPRFQHLLLDRAARHPGIATQRVLRDARGADLVPVTVSDKPSLMAVYSWVPGEILAEIPEHSDRLLHQWGELAGNLVVALRDVDSDDSIDAVHPWEVMAAPRLLHAVLPAVADSGQRALVEAAIANFEAVVSPRAHALPRSVVHQDLNDYNVLAGVAADGEQKLCGVIDFADALETARVAEVAVAAAYAMLRKADPVHALLAVVQGYVSVVTLTDDEISVLYPLAMARLALNAATWAARAGGIADDYGRARSKYTWATLSALSEVSAAEVESRIRESLNTSSTTKDRAHLL